ncbi:hypothetical protein CHS0354_032235 [Potamilus streckersoni]|uniref:Malonyl-CoA decarboxylase n=1 Tax=Potamilus streckersoni TaxID=2493646 RepID=A0AAE0RPT2_9BIVA|nr:hypothetical protein CHS0354_032235 [Potamilus streckersoni]
MKQVLLHDVKPNRRFGSCRPDLILQCRRMSSSSSSCSSSPLPSLEQNGHKGIQSPSSPQEFLQTVFGSNDQSTLSIESTGKRFCQYYAALVGDEKLEFLLTLSKKYGANQDSVVQVSQSLVAAQERGEAILLKVEERLRHTLIPRYQHLFSQIGRIEGGVKFLVDLRADILTFMGSSTVETDIAYVRTMNNVLRDLLSLWFSVGLLSLQRITWESPCDIVQKISDYEAVHPIRNWSDLKRRVGPYRRCFVFTHTSMPREPVVVLHTALTNDISTNIHSIIQKPGFRTPEANIIPAPDESDNTVDDLDETEDPNKITTAVFYSITSTQRGLQGVDLGNYLIKKVVRSLQAEFPRIYQFSSMSPIPGFRDWLVTEINRELHLKDIGELKEPWTNILKEDDIPSLDVFKDHDNQDPLEIFKKIVQSNNWLTSPETVKPLLMRLCARYLYLEKRRNYALNPVANFHLQNGAVLWRLNWMADTSVRGLVKSCGMMVNYRYFLDQTEENSKKYLEEYVIVASQQIMDLANSCTEKE